jgi:hypothetical protein
MTHDQLEAAMQRALSALKEIPPEQLEMKHDFYWDIGFKDQFNLMKNPSDLTVGQLSNDVERLTRIAEDEGMFVFEHLHWLGMVLSYYGRTLGRVSLKGDVASG